MDRKLLKRYKSNQNEIALIDKALDRLYARLEDVPVVSGKVTKSGDEFPYIEEHMTVKMAEPKESTELKNRIRDKENRKNALLAENARVEGFITGMPEGIDKQVFELVYLEGFTQQETAEMTEYSKGRISQIISKYAKD